MTLTEARDLLVLKTSADAEPVVTNAQVETFLGYCKLVDSSNLAPTDDDWEPTWDLDHAEALIYERKAALISQQVTFERDGSKFDLTDRVQGYREMAAKARARRTFGIPLDLSLEDDSIALSE